jgi:hypothetical protein
MKKKINKKTQNFVSLLYIVKTCESLKEKKKQITLIVMKKKYIYIMHSTTTQTQNPSKEHLHKSSILK